MALKQALARASSTLGAYNEEGELYRKYGRDWRLYADAALARVRAEIDKPDRERRRDDDLHTESEARRKLAESQFEELQAQRAAQRLADAQKFAEKNAVVLGDGRVFVPGNIPEEFTRGTAPESVSSMLRTVSHGLTSAERQRVAEEDRKLADRRALRDDTYEDQVALARLREGMNFETWKKREDYLRQNPREARPMTRAQAHAAVIAEAKLGGRRVRLTSDEIEQRVQDMLAQTGEIPEAPGGPAGSVAAPEYLLRRGDEIGGAPPTAQSGQQTKVINGVTYVKTPGGWAKAK